MYAKKTFSFSFEARLQITFFNVSYKIKAFRIMTDLSLTRKPTKFQVTVDLCKIFHDISEQKSRGLFRTQSNIQDGAFCENS